MRPKRSDIIAGVAAGILIAVLSNAVLANLALHLGVFRWMLVAILPILIVLGLYIASFLSRYWATLWQLAKFLVTGALNTFVDLGILNFLGFVTGIFTGWHYSAFKAISFVGSVINSFFWNKFWVFEKKDVSSAGKEFPKFILVSTVGIVLNTGIASLLVIIIGPPAGISGTLWGNIAAIIAGLTVFVWNFLGYKLIVFRGS